MLCDSLTLEPQPGKSLFGGQRRERIDSTALNKLMGNPELLPKYDPSDRKNQFNSADYSYEAHLLSLWNNVEFEADGSAWLRTFWEKKCRYGRLYAKRSVAMLCTERTIRQTLVSQYYTDLDIASCHPNIMRQMLSKAGRAEEFPVLKRLCDDRESLRAELMKNGMSKDMAKQCYLAAMFGGAPWNDVAKDADTTNLRAFGREMEKIGSIIRNANPDMVDAIAARKSVNPKKIKASQVCSYFCQEVERRVMEAVARAIAEAGGFDEKLLVYQYDGIFVPKEHWRDEYTELAKEAVLKATGLVLSFEMKAMESGIDLSNVEAKPYTLDVLAKETLVNLGVTPEVQSSRYLQLDTEEIKNHRSVVLEASPGVGKTTSVARYIASLRKSSDDLINVLLISNLRSLGRQMIETFQSNGIPIESHQQINGELDLEEYRGISVCINSLGRVKDEDEIWRNTVVVIDEATSLAETLVGASTIQRTQREVTKILGLIMRSAKQVIMMDATISDAAMCLLHHRGPKGLHFIKNTTRGFDKVPAIRHSEEEAFLARIAKGVENSDCFLAAFDSATVADKYYCHMKDLYPDKESRMILVTRDTPLPEDVIAGHHFNGKYVFYSPSITTGVDYSTPVPTLQFVHITGKSISPLGCFQQACRTRNISELHYFANIKSTSGAPLTIKQAEESLASSWLDGDNIRFRRVVNCYCRIEDENGKDILIRNSMFKLTATVLSIDSRLRGRFMDSFQALLIDAGFVLADSHPCQVQALKKETDKNQRLLRQEFKDTMALEALKQLCGKVSDSDTDYEQLKSTINHFIPHLDVIGLLAEDPMDINLSDPQNAEAVSIVKDLCINHGAQDVAMAAPIYFCRRGFAAGFIEKAQEESFGYLASKGMATQASVLREAFHEMCGEEANPLDISPGNFDASKLTDKTFDAINRAFKQTADSRRPKKPSTNAGAHELFGRTLRKLLGGTKYVAVKAESSRASRSGNRQRSTTYSIDTEAICRLLRPQLSIGMNGEIMEVNELLHNTRMTPFDPAMQAALTRV